MIGIAAGRASPGGSGAAARCRAGAQVEGGTGVAYAPPRAAEVISRKVSDIDSTG